LDTPEKPLFCSLAKWLRAGHRQTMQRKTFVLTCACLIAVVAGAAEKIPLLKVSRGAPPGFSVSGGNDFVYYTNVVVTTATATDVFFSHSRGMGNAKLKNLEPEIQQRFGFNATKAQEAEKKQADANLAFRRDLSASPKTVPFRETVTRPSSGETIVPGDIPVREIHALSFRGRTAPRFVVEKWLTTRPDMTGKFVLVDFWATWCGPCRASIPKLNDLHAKFGDKLVIVGLSDEEENDVRAMKSPKIDYFVGIDRSANMKTAVGVRGIPHALILDPNGVVRFEGHPGNLNERNVAGLLAKYSP
jgi:cytochrome c biogenesis protein CcmG, thiol:disulfide interchange protein DsbE